jgi:exodeoxyribonuclease-3
LKQGLIFEYTCEYAFQHLIQRKDKMQKKELQLSSWNVNGIRACVKKGFLYWLSEFKPDICCIQETKAQKDQLLQEITEPPDYTSFWFSAIRKGYSGVACYIKNSVEIDEYKEGLGIRDFDTEGRTSMIQIGSLAIINCYFPNSQHNHSRLDYKLDYDKAVHEYVDNLRDNGLQTIICGDFNVAHKEIDLKNPKANIDNPGFLPEEREWMSHFLGSGYVDTFRYFYPDMPDQYTWWTYRGRAREKNIGWRIDYFCTDQSLIQNLEQSTIHPHITGSDHCPISLNIRLTE